MCPFRFVILRSTELTAYHSCSLHIKQPCPPSLMAAVSVWKVERRVLLPQSQIDLVFVQTTSNKKGSWSFPSVPYWSLLRASKLFILNTREMVDLSLRINGFHACYAYIIMINVAFRKVFQSAFPPHAFDIIMYFRVLLE